MSDEKLQISDKSTNVFVYPANGLTLIPKVWFPYVPIGYDKPSKKELVNKPTWYKEIVSLGNSVGPLVLTLFIDK